MIKRVERVLNRKVDGSSQGSNCCGRYPEWARAPGKPSWPTSTTRSRFQRNKAIGCYFGLIPKQDASGRSNRLGHITREGPSVVRSLLVEAAWQGIRRCPRIRVRFTNASSVATRNGRRLPWLRQPTTCFERCWPCYRQARFGGTRQKQRESQLEASGRPSGPGLRRETASSVDGLKSGAYGKRIGPR